MSIIAGENHDLQTYLDSFNKEIEDDDASTITLSEAVDNFGAAEEEDETILQENEEEEVDVKEDMYFIDNEGNYYVRSRHNSESENSDTAKPSELRKSVTVLDSSRNLKKTTTATYSKADVDDEATEMSFVVIMESDTDKVSQGDVLDDPDDPDAQIYDFDENEAVGVDVDDKDFVLTGRVVKLKPTTSKSNPNDVIHRCFHCDYTTTKRYVLSRHMKAHSDDRPYKCGVCERGFKTNASLMNHVNSHLGKKPHACKSCEMCFTTSGELVRHIRYRHTGEKPHKCSECDYCSVELSKLRRHMRCHTGERPYQCPHCTYASPDTFKLKRHMRTHTGEKPYECDICHARFTQSNSLKAHRLIHSVNDKPVFQCSLCPTTCGRKTDLRLHVQKLHHSEQPITCKRCNKDLPDRYSYKVHIKSHEGEKCYRCQICPYASISMRHLETHMLIHTDQKPFLCDHCDLAFRQRQLLKRHINLYHNKNYKPPTPREKVHSCPHCDRSFTHKGNLMRHMEMHDPDSNLQREKIELQIGRLSRVQPDGTTVVIDEAYDDAEENGSDPEFEENLDSNLDEEFEIIETIEEFEQKPDITHSGVIDAEDGTELEMTELKNVSIKEEPNGKEFVAVEVADGQGYMVVEVITCEDEEEDDDNTVAVGNSAGGDMQMTTLSSSMTNIENCFGFEEDMTEPYDKSRDIKKTMQLFDMLD